MKKYKLSKTNVVDKFCSQYKNYYLLEDENGRTLREIADELHELLVMTITYHQLITAVKYAELKEKQNKKGK